MSMNLCRADTLFFVKVQIVLDPPPTEGKERRSLSRSYEAPDGRVEEFSYTLGREIMGDCARSVNCWTGPGLHMDTVIHYPRRGDPKSGLVTILLLVYADNPTVIRVVVEKAVSEKLMYKNIWGELSHISIASYFEMDEMLATMDDCTLYTYKDGKPVDAPIHIPTPASTEHAE